MSIWDGCGCVYDVASGTYIVTCYGHQPVRRDGETTQELLRRLETETRESTPPEIRRWLAGS